MFDVLVYLYETYWRPDACPDHAQLTRKLSAVGFETDEIQEALVWLDGLAVASQSYQGQQRKPAEPSAPTRTPGKSAETENSRQQNCPLHRTGPIACV